jgi:hypothetical protein
LARLPLGGSIGLMGFQNDRTNGPRCRQPLSFSAVEPNRLTEVD